MNKEMFLPEFNYDECISRLNNNEKIMMMVLKKYNGRELLTNILENLGKSDFEKAAFDAHTLKGVAANLSLNLVAEAAKTVEHSLKSTSSVSDGDIEILKAAVDSTEEKLNTFLQK